MLLLRAGAFGCGFPLDEAEIERLPGGPPRLTFEDVVAHPRLPDARKAYIDRFLEVYGGDPFLVRLLRSNRAVSFSTIWSPSSMRCRIPRAARPG
jgi:hypothetical protein